jgi:hypothetical protein
MGQKYVSGNYVQGRKFMFVLSKGGRGLRDIKHKPDKVSMMALRGWFSTPSLRVVRNRPERHVISGPILTVTIAASSLVVNEESKPSFTLFLELR